MKAIWIEMLAIVEDHDILVDKALLPLQQSLSNVKQLSQSLDILGKQTLTTIDKFTRPMIITSKRRERVVDKWHGGNKGKRVRISDDPKKKEESKRELLWWMSLVGYDFSSCLLGFKYAFIYLFYIFVKLRVCHVPTSPSFRNHLSGCAA